MDGDGGRGMGMTISGVRTGRPWLGQRGVSGNTFLTLTTGPPPPSLVSRLQIFLKNVGKYPLEEFYRLVTSSADLVVRVDPACERWMAMAVAEWG